MDVTGLSRSTVMQRLGRPALGGPAARAAGGRPVQRRPPAAALTFNERVGVVLAADLGARHGRLAVCDLAGVAARRARGADPHRRRAGAGARLGRAHVRRLLGEAGRTRDRRARARRSACPARSRSRRAPGQPAAHARLGRLSGRGAARRALRRARRCSSATSTRWRSASTAATGATCRTWCSSRSRPGSARGSSPAASCCAATTAAPATSATSARSGQSDVMCTCGNRGCVAVLATRLRRRPAARRGGRSRSPRPPMSSSWCAAATRWPCITSARPGRVLGAALAAVVSVVAPSVIVIGGEMADASEPLIAGIRESVYKHASALATRELRILTSRLGPARRRGRGDHARARARARAGQRRRAARPARARRVILAVQENLVAGDARGRPAGDRAGGRLRRARAARRGAPGARRGARPLRRPARSSGAGSVTSTAPGAGRAPTRCARQLDGVAALGGTA